MTSPSTLMVPSARTFPVMTVPLAMMDSAPSARRTSAREFGFWSSRSKDISVSLLHQRERIDHDTLLADLEVQVRSARVPGVPGQPDHLTGRHPLPRADDEAREV